MSASSPFLTESHNMRQDDRVTFTDRFSGESYQGTIYSIVSLQENKYYKYSQYVDYFYIMVSQKDLHKLLERGFEVIVNHRPAVIGNIERERRTRDGEVSVIKKLYIQNGAWSDETEISLDSVNAILVWRIQFDIQKN
jgi:hypothetical protein